MNDWKRWPGCALSWAAAWGIAHLCCFTPHFVLAQYDDYAYGYVEASDGCYDYDGCDGCDGCDSSCVQPAPCPWEHRCGVWGEYLYLQATGADMAHAQQSNGADDLGDPNTMPFGRTGTVDPDYEPGFRVGGNWALDRCSSIAASYTFYESNAADFISPPDIPGDGGSVHSLVLHPGAVINRSTGPLNASYDIDFQLADVEYRRLWFGCNRHWLNYSFGARYGQLRQDFRQTGIFGVGFAGVTDTSTQIDFDGGGLKFGLDGERLIGCCGFSIYGRGSVSPLVGEFRSDYTMRDATSNILLANVVWSDDRFVTLLDYELGLAWTGPCGHFRFSAGYMASFWFNAVTTPAFVDAVQADNYVDPDGTISFDGLTARAEFRF